MPMKQLLLAVFCIAASFSLAAEEHLTVEMVTNVVFDMKKEALKKDQTGSLKYFTDDTKFYGYYTINGTEKVETANLDQVKLDYSTSKQRKYYLLLSKDILTLNIKITENGKKAEVFTEARSYYLYLDKHYSNIRQTSYIFGLKDSNPVILEVHSRNLSNITN